MNPSKNKGTAFETAVVRYCRENGFPLAERIALHGNKDIGDVRLAPGVILECKAHANYSDAQIVEWLDETATEMANGNSDHGTLVVKRAYKPIGQAWAVHTHRQTGAPVYMHLGDALVSYRRNGYGDPL